MTEPENEQPDGIEDVEAPEVPEPDTPEQGLIDPDDDYTEGAE